MHSPDRMVSHGEDPIEQHSSVGLHGSPAGCSPSATSSCLLAGVLAIVIWPYYLGATSPAAALTPRPVQPMAPQLGPAHAADRRTALPPADEAELAAIVADAAAADAARVVGGGTRPASAGRCRPPRRCRRRGSPASRSTSRPRLVLSARAGTPLAEIEALLAEQRPAARLRADGPPRLLRHRRASRRSARSPRPTSPARAASRPAPPATA